MQIAKFKNCIKVSLWKILQIINLSLCKSHERDYSVCVNEDRRENKRLSILRPSSSGRESHPVQEVFLPSRWAATEMKISHLNFFAFVSLPSVTGRLDWWYRIRNPEDNSDATLCHPALISDDGTLVFFARPLYQGCHPGFLGRDNFFQHSLFFLYFSCCKSHKLWFLIKQ